MTNASACAFARLPPKEHVEPLAIRCCATGSQHRTPMETVQARSKSQREKSERMIFKKLHDHTCTKDSEMDDKDPRHQRGWAKGEQWSSRSQPPIPQVHERDSAKCCSVTQNFKKNKRHFTSNFLSRSPPSHHHTLTIQTLLEKPVCCF